MTLQRWEWLLVLAIGAAGVYVWGLVFLVGYVPTLVLVYRIGLRRPE